MDRLEEIIKVRLSKATRARLKKAAISDLRSESAMIRALIIKGLDRLEQPRQPVDSTPTHGVMDEIAKRQERNASGDFPTGPDEYRTRRDAEEGDDG